jgi:hypothetical protein
LSAAVYANVALRVPQRAMTKPVGTWLPRRRGIRRNETVREGASRQRPVGANPAFSLRNFSQARVTTPIFPKREIQVRIPSGAQDESLESIERCRHYRTHWYLVATLDRLRTSVFERGDVAIAARCLMGWGHSRLLLLAAASAARLLTAQVWAVSVPSSTPLLTPAATSSKGRSNSTPCDRK